MRLTHARRQDLSLHLHPSLSPPSSIELKQGLLTCMVQHAGWSQTFTLLGLAGVAAAAVCGLMLPRERRAAEQRRAWQAPTGLGSLDRDASAHLVVLCFTHSVVSFSFFILQAWIPSFLASTGMSRLSSIGFVSALPWLVSSQQDSTPNVRSLGLTLLL